MRHKFLKVTALFVASVFAMSAQAQTNIIADWDGGSSTGKPTEYGWSSSNSGRSWSELNVSSGARMMTNYSGYKLEDGSEYSYSGSSELSSKILWIRYKDTSETYTYTFSGLQAGRSYTFSGLVGWHNNPPENPTFTITVNGESEFAKLTKAITSKQTMYGVSADFDVPFSDKSTDFTLKFTLNSSSTVNDCMEALSALSIVENKEAYKPRLETLILQAKGVNTKVTGLDDAIAQAESALADENADLFSAITTLQTAMDSKLAAATFNAEGDDVTSLFLNAGFDEGINFAASSTENTAPATSYPTLGWTSTLSANCTGAVIGYGFGGYINGEGNVKAPTSNNDGKAEGGMLFICVGWSGTVTYKSLPTTLPKGAYTITYTAYNGNIKNTEAVEIIPMIGFVPESGEAIVSNTKETFDNQKWVEKSYTFILNEATKGQMQIGMKPTTNTGSNNSPELFIDGITLTYKDPVAVVKSQLEAEIATAKEAEVPEEGKSILNAAIQAAESTLANATTEEEVLQAVTTLRVSVNKAKLVGASYATPSTELLVNGSFDTQDAGWKLTNMGYQQNNERPTRYVEKWNGSALTGSGSATQTIKDLPAGAYRLTGFANANNENATNVSLAVNSTSYTVSGSWKLYDILYNHETDGDLTITFSYNNTNANWVCVDEFSLVYGGEYNAYAMAMYKVLWNNALTEATTAIKDAAYVNVIGEEKANLQNEIDKAEPTTVDDYKAAINAIQEKTETFKAAKTNYDRLAQDVAIAKALGVAEATADSYAATTTSTAALAATNDNGLNVVTYNQIKETFTHGVTLGSWTENFAEDLDGEGYKAGGEKYFNEWNGGNVTRTAKQTVTLPAGEYAISSIGRGTPGVDAYLYYKIGDETTKTNFVMKGNRGLGVDTLGNANFTAPTEENGIGYNCNNEGFGWEYRFLSLKLETETEVEIGISANFTNTWVSFYAPKILTTEASIKTVHLTTIESLLAEVPTGAMNAEIKSTLDEKVTAAKNATDQNTIDELATISSELRDAVLAAKPSAEAYEKINGYITRAKEFDATAVADYEQKYNTGKFVNDDVTTVQQELNIMTYNVVANNFVNSVELGTWTKEGDTGEKSDQHWSGETRAYLEQSSAAWGANSWDIKYSQDVVLPAGEYVFKVSGRKSADATLNLEVSMGETTLSVSDFPSNSEGLGINKNGVASFDAADEVGFVNNNKGYGWQWRFVKFTLADKDTVKIAVNANARTNHQWVSFCDYTLQMGDATYMAVYTPTYNAYLNEAKALNEQAMGNEEKAALEKVIKENETAPTTPATLKAQSDSLKAAIEFAKPSADAYAWIYNSIANAKAFGIDASTYETKYNERAYTIAQADTVHQELNVATYAQVAADYNNEYALTGWSTDELGTTKGQHWSGHGDKEYYDTNGSNFARSTVKTVTLPKGSFVLKAAGRSSTAAKLTLDVNGTMVEFHAKGDVGYGIDTLGVANFSKKGIYANNNNGRGWEWQFAKFTLDDVTEVTLKATISAGEAWGWGSLSDVSLWMDDATFEGMRVAAKAELNAEITKAESLATTNVGDGAFQILTTDENLKTLKNAIATAKVLYESSEATTEMLLAAVPTLQQAEATYKSTISGAKLNAPAADQKYSIVLTYKGWDYDGKAMTYIANDRNDAGLYNIKYAVEPNASYAQAFTFTPAESVTNGYYLSMTDVDGNERYISTGVEYGGQAAQIRTTINEEKALVVQVRATATEGVYNLWNTEAKNYLGSQDAGVYTVNSHIDFKLTPAEEAEVTVDITIGYATVILPFNAELPAGMSAYTCTAEGEALTLSEVYSLEANTPYVIKGDGNFEFSGYGLAAKSTYEKGSLIGTYAEVNAPVGSYVLMQQDGLAAFYKVDEGMESKVDAYCCYLNVPAATAPMFSFERNGGATGIDNSQLTNGNSQLIIYDLMGRRVDTMVKGNMYIVNGRKVVMK